MEPHGERGAWRAGAALAVCALLCPGGGVQGQGLVADQQQLAVAPSAPGFRVGGPGGQALAQTVTAGRDGDLAAVRVPLSCSPGLLTLEVRTLEGAVPGAQLLASRTVSGAAFPAEPAPGAFATVDLAPGVRLGRGQRFALVLRSTGTCEVAAGPVGDPYPGGDAFFRNRDFAPGVWAALGPRADLPFQTLVEPAGPGDLPPPPDDAVRGFVQVRCFVELLGNHRDAGAPGRPLP